MKSAIPRSRNDFPSLAEEAPRDAEIIAPKRTPLPFIFRSTLGIAATLIIGSPLFFGGNWPSTQQLLQGGVFLLVLIVTGNALVQKSPIFLQGDVRRFVRYASALLAIGLFQLVPLPLSLLDVISPHAVEGYRIAGAEVGSISVEPHTTWRQVVWLSGLVAFVVSLCVLPEKFVSLSSSRKKKRQRSRRSSTLLQVDFVVYVLQQAIIVSAILAAVIGLAHWTVRAELLYGLFPSPRGAGDIQRAHWPFTNPDHFVVLMEIGSALCLLRIFQHGALRRSRDGSSSSRPHGQTGFLVHSLRHPEKFSAEIRYLMGFTVVVLGGLLTLSRAGIPLILGGALAFWITARSLLPKDREIQSSRSSLFKIAMSSMLVLGFFFLVLFLIGDLGREYLSLRLQYGLLHGYDEIRRALATASIDVYLSAPILGVGLGCWHLAASEFVGEGLAGWRLDYAHNEPLQLLAEVGTIGSLMALCAVGVAIGATVRAWRDDRTPWQRLCIAGSCYALLLPLLHSLVDFPFHIPALAIIYSALLALHFRTLANRPQVA